MSKPLLHLCRVLLPVVALALTAAATSHAGEGVLEINQSCALVGCFDGDLPGLPVEITEAGSYRLTGNLNANGSASGGIRILADGVTLDLGGFTVGFCQGLNPVFCAPGGLADGIDGGTATEVTVHSGVVRDFAGRGIDLGQRARVEGVSVVGNGSGGLRVLDNSLVERNRIAFNDGIGAALGFGTAWGANVLAGNDTDVAGTPIAIAHNLCSGRRCGRVQARKYYLTEARYDGSEANGRNVCANGFHFASYPEIADPSALEYDTTRGLTGLDTGSGPPAIQGWVRSASTTSSGTVNCNLWNGGGGGTAAFLQILLPGAAEASSPWRIETEACADDFRVWCVED